MKTAYKLAIKLTVVAAAVFFTISSIQIPITALTHTRPAGSHVLTPIASGITTHSNEEVTLNASSMSEGYIMVKYAGSMGKIKVQTTKSGSETYTCDLSSSDIYEVFPLSEGNGSYSVKVFGNIQGNRHSQVFSQNVNTIMTNQFGPFLHPNQYMNFSVADTAVQMGASVVASTTDQLEVVSNVYNYVVNNATYDMAKISSIQSGHLPNMDVVLAQKKGICLDYTVLMIAMLESQDIPIKLVVGYTGNLYHTWINVYPGGQGRMDSIICSDDNSWRLIDLTSASPSNQSQRVMQYIGNGSSYRVKYSY